MTALAQGHDAYGLSPDAPQVEAAAKHLWGFLGLRRPWDQATEVARDKARMLAAVVMEALLTHERDTRSATAEDTIMARFWPPSYETPMKQDFADSTQTTIPGARP